MAFSENAQDYLDAGVEPPEYNPHGMPGDDNEAAQSIINAAGAHTHTWAQKGNQIECTAGAHPHGHLIPPTQLLIGTTPKGAPILRPIDIQA